MSILLALLAFCLFAATSAETCTTRDDCPGQEVCCVWLSPGAAAGGYVSYSLCAGVGGEC
ncbi:uncharacterized protein MYCGRDRAFT_81208, partial [Zymoseptoria tritici IPO323]